MQRDETNSFTADNIHDDIFPLEDFAIHWFDAGHGSLAMAEQILDEKLALDFFGAIVSRARLSLN